MSSQSAMGAISSPGVPYYAWEPADKLISVHLYFDVIDRIIPEVMRGFTSLPRRGAEVGGILLGRISPGQRLEVTVEEVEFVPCEYLSGPSFHLSGRDLEGLEEMLARRGSDEALTVVGCFRSHTRKDLFLDDQDVALFARYFSSPGNVFLLIKPYATRASTAGFFFWEDGEVQRDSSYQEFPFGRRELGGGDPRAGMRNRGAEPVLPRHAEPLAGRPERPEPPQPPQRPPETDAPRPEPLPSPGGLSILSAPEPREVRPASSSRRWLWAPALLLISAVGGYVGLQLSKQPGPAAGAKAPLRLAVVENQGQLDMVWDHLSTSVTQARSGVLTIQDGNLRRDIELTPAQLQDGRVRYSRITGDVTVRLEVNGTNGQTQSESIRIIAKETTPPPPLSEPPAETAAAPPASGPSSAPAPTPARSAEPPAAEPPAAAPQPESEARTTPPVKPRAAGDSPSAEPRRPRKRSAMPSPPKREPAAQAPPPEPAEPAIDITPGRRR